MDRLAQLLKIFDNIAMVCPMNAGDTVPYAINRAYQDMAVGAAFGSAMYPVEVAPVGWRENCFRSHAGACQPKSEGHSPSTEVGQLQS